MIPATQTTQKGAGGTGDDSRLPAPAPLLNQPTESVGKTPGSGAAPRAARPSGPVPAQTGVGSTEATTGRLIQEGGREDAPDFTHGGRTL